jgi:acetyl esterase
MALDQATRTLIGIRGEGGTTDPSSMGLIQARRSVHDRRFEHGNPPDMHSISQIEAPGPDGPVRITVHRPATRVRGLVLWLHGGGWVLGSAEAAAPVARHLASLTRCLVAVIDYRLAPEHPYPSALRDVWSGLEWAHREASRGTKRLPVVLAGNGSGANLAAVTALRAVGVPEMDVAAQLLVCPVTDCDVDRPSYLEAENQVPYSRASHAWFWDQYAPAPHVDRTDPNLSPLRAADLTGLPPTVLLTAEHDALRDEGTAYANRLRATGVPVRDRCFLGQAHGFLAAVRYLPASGAALTYLAEELVDLGVVPW